MVVDGAVGLPMRYFDGEGVIWNADPFSGAVSAPPAPNMRAYYQLNNCTGTRYLEVGDFSAGGQRPTWKAPRIPFLDAVTNELRVFEDDATLVTTTVCAYLGGPNSPGACNFNSCWTATGILESDSRVIQPPTLPGTPPYHPVE
jgi:hypothetical protein